MANCPTQLSHSGDALGGINKAHHFTISGPNCISKGGNHTERPAATLTAIGAVMMAIAPPKVKSSTWQLSTGLAWVYLLLTP